MVGTMRYARNWLAMASLTLGLSACSLQTLEEQACTASAECRAQFGMGSQCLTDGLCTAPAPCTSTLECERTHGIGSICGARQGVSGNSCALPTAYDCSSDAACAAIGLGTVCLSDGSCQRPGGAVCLDDAECEERFGAPAVCEAATGLCQRGGGCTEDGPCVDTLGFGATCDAGACVPPAGGACDTTATCEARYGFGSSCDGQGRCSAPTATGCTNNADCVTAVGFGATCRDDGVCAPPPVRSCTGDTDCTAAYGLGATCQGSGLCTAPTTCDNDPACVSAFGFGHRCTSAQICVLPEVTDCGADTDCRAVYGWASQCQEDGLCSQPSRPGQCLLTWPVDFWQKPRDYRDTIAIGALLSFTNNTVEKNAIELAVRRLNEQGGLDGKRYSVIFCDYGVGEGSSAGQLATFLADTAGVPAIIGGFSSATTQLAFVAIRDAGADTLLMSPTSSNPALTDLDETDPTDARPGMLWRTTPGAGFQTQVLAQRLVADFPTPPASFTVSVLVESFGGGAELESILTDELRAQLGETPVRITRHTFSPGDPTQRNAAVDGAARENPDAVVVLASLSTTLQSILAYAADVAPLSTSQFYVTDAGYGRLLLRQASIASNDVLNRVTGTRLLPSSDYSRFEDDYNAATAPAYPTDPSASPYAAATFDAAWLVMYGTAWSIISEDGAVTGTGIARGLRHVVARVGQTQTANTTFPSQFLRVRNEFRAQRAVDVTGASGPLDFDLDTEELPVSTVEVWTINTDCSVGDVDGRCFRAEQQVEP